MTGATRLICLENTLNGLIVPQEVIVEIAENAKKEEDLKLHLDGESSNVDRELSSLESRPSGACPIVVDGVRLESKAESLLIFSLFSVVIGARIFEVAAETGMSLKELLEPFDSASICFSKGIGAPYGR